LAVVLLFDWEWDRHVFWCSGASGFVVGVMDIHDKKKKGTLGGNSLHNTKMCLLLDNTYLAFFSVLE